MEAHWWSVDGFRVGGNKTVAGSGEGLHWSSAEEEKADKALDTQSI
jgi:hypothetical protein